jgi:hypothetical protein
MIVYENLSNPTCTRWRDVERGHSPAWSSRAFRQYQEGPCALLAKAFAVHGSMQHISLFKKDIQHNTTAASQQPALVVVFRLLIGRGL